MKVCTKCKTERPLDWFNVKRAHSTGMDPQCRECKTKAYNTYREKNAARIAAYQAKYAEAHKEELRDYKRKYYRGEVEARQTLPQDAYSRACKERAERYKQDNLSLIRAKKNAAAVLLRKKNPASRIKASLRSRLIAVLHGKNKSADTATLIGCSWEQLREYLEQQFVPGMSWDNYGDWHIDHVIPCASFDLTVPENQHKCFHYTNLQPLWKLDNIRKGAKLLGVCHR